MRGACTLCGAMLVVAWVPMISGSAGGQQTEVAERGIVFEDVKELLAEADAFKAIEYVNEQGAPEIVAERYAELAKDFYWKDKALDRVVTFSRAGIQYCLTKAQELRQDDPEMAEKLRLYARIISYNMASFAWPGWDEPGVVVSETDLEAGLDAARLTVRLTIELDQGPDKLANAQWVLGAQLLAAGEYTRAVEAYRQCEMKGAEAGDRSLELLGSGYAGIAMILGGQGEGQGLLEAAIGGFKELDTEDSEFFMGQLNTALRVFGGE